MRNAPEHRIATEDMDAAGNPPAVSIRLWIRPRLGEPEGWQGLVTFGAADRPADLAAAIDDTFSQLRERVREVLG